MIFILLFGPPAVGKMTVGKEIAKQTGLKLFHNHMTIEIVLPFFDFGTPPFGRLSNLFRHEIMREIAESDVKGMIFTYVWALDVPGEKEDVDNFVNIFTKNNAKIILVELGSDLKIRLERNKGETRLLEKPSKRDIAQSEKRLLANEEKYVLSSKGDFKHKDEFENYLYIDNSELSQLQTAELIISKFKLV